MKEGGGPRRPLDPSRRKESIVKPRPITKALYQIGGSDMTDPKDCSVYLLDLGELVLIDTGAGSSVDKLVANMTRLGLTPGNLSAIVLTHCHIDHVGGAGELRKRFGAQTIMHRIEAEIVERGDTRMTAAFWYGVPFPPLTIDRKLDGEEARLAFGDHELVCLHTPGHSPGSMSAYVDMDGKRVLFGQDIHGPFLKDFGADLKAWTRSMETLLALEADILCEGHFGVYEPAAKVRQYIERYLDEYGE
jgi:glyoxylase-like metal-dependent hydrolase (beta-lactamase superfamily II)